MKPIAVFYHCIISTGSQRQIDSDYALNLVSDQMSAVKQSGLSDVALEMIVGINGGDSDAFAVAMLCPNKATVICHGKGSTTEIPTMNILREWAKTHPDWYVLYHHTKGVSTPNLADGWRRRMELYCVWNWKVCVSALDSGSEACGCHWLTPEQNPGVIHSPFFGGTFWWAKSGYINRLPPLPEPTWQNRYEAETWIGKGNPRPRVSDFYTGWPKP